jgi:hypothetical protein
MQGTDVSSQESCYQGEMQTVSDGYRIADLMLSLQRLGADTKQHECMLLHHCDANIVLPFVIVFMVEVQSPHVV